MEEIKFDIFIPIHSKDFKKIDFLISSIERNIPGYNKIFIVSNEPLDKTFPNQNIMILNEKEVLNVDLSKINHRNTWIYQQMLKLLQNVTNDWFLTIDSDCFINKRIDVISENGQPNFIINQIPDRGIAYFKYSQKYFNLEKKYEFSFVSELMLFNRKLILEMFNSIGLSSIDDVIDFFYKTITEEEHLSEFELYGNYIMENYPNLYKIKRILSRKTGLHDFEDNYSDEKINEIISKNSNYDVIQYHTWRCHISLLEWFKTILDPSSNNKDDLEKLKNIDIFLKDGRN